VAEGARLESVYTARYPGFESLSLRHNFIIPLQIIHIQDKVNALSDLCRFLAYPLKCDSSGLIRSSEFGFGLGKFGLELAEPFHMISRTATARNASFHSVLTLDDLPGEAINLTNEILFRSVHPSLDA
jgi:hypothetical protein